MLRRRVEGHHKKKAKRRRHQVKVQENQNDAETPREVDTLSKYNTS